MWHLLEVVTFELNHNYSNPWYTGLHKESEGLFLGMFPNKCSGSIGQRNVNYSPMHSQGGRNHSHEESERSGKISLKHGPVCITNRLGKCLIETEKLA